MYTLDEKKRKSTTRCGHFHCSSLEAVRFQVWHIFLVRHSVQHGARNTFDTNQSFLTEPGISRPAGLRNSKSQAGPGFKPRA